MKSRWYKFLYPLLLLSVTLAGIACENVGFIDETGAPYGIKQIDNKPRVSSMPYTFDIAEGNIPDHISVNKFGHNPAVAATLETIWGGGNLYQYMTVADQLEIVSSNDEDGGAGGDTGALTMEIFGQDANYIEINETIV